MALAPSSDNIILGKGELFFDRYAPSTGARTGFFHLGNCAKFAISFEDDVLELYTSQDAAAGLLKSVTRKRKVKVSISSNEMGIENLALALMGDQGSFTQTTGTVTQTITAIQAGRFYQLSKRSVAITSVVQGTATLSATTDYTLYDSAMGLLQFVATGAATTASPAVVIFTHSASTASQIFAATKTKIEGGLLFVPDPTTGPQFDVEVWRTSVTPGGEIGFIGEEFGEYELNLSALSDATGTYGGSSSDPYFRLIQRGTA